MQSDDVLTTCAQMSQRLAILENIILKQFGSAIFAEGESIIKLLDENLSSLHRKASPGRFIFLEKPEGKGYRIRSQARRQLLNVNEEESEEISEAHVTPIDCEVSDWKDEALPLLVFQGFSPDVIGSDEEEEVQDPLDEELKEEVPSKAVLDEKSGKLECGKCGKRFSKMAHFKTHSLLHRFDNKYKCEKCKEGFRTEFLCKEHRRTHLEQRPFKCGSCPKRFRTKKGLLSHVPVHSSGAYQCHICSRAFKWEKGLVRHYFTHAAVKPFSCPECSERCITIQNVKSHMKVKHGVFDFTPYTFKKNSDFEEEIKKIMSSPKLEISEAGGIAPREMPPHLTTRTLLKHDERETANPGTDLGNGSKETEGSEELICDLCGMRLRRGLSLKRHMSLHGNDGKYKCEHCHQGFRTEKLKAKHKRTHVEYRPFKCQVCSFAFKHKYKLDRHVKSHSVGSHECHLCSKKFSRKDALDGHYFIHATHKPYSCPMCDGRFTALNTLKAHLQSQHQLTDFNGYTFEMNSEFLEEMKEINPNYQPRKKRGGDVEGEASSDDRVYDFGCKFPVLWRAEMPLVFRILKLNASLLLSELRQAFQNPETVIDGSEDAIPWFRVDQEVRHE